MRWARTTAVAAARAATTRPGSHRGPLRSHTTKRRTRPLGTRNPGHPAHPARGSFELTGTASAPAPPSHPRSAAPCGGGRGDAHRRRRQRSSSDSNPAWLPRTVNDTARVPGRDGHPPRFVSRRPRRSGRSTRSRWQQSPSSEASRERAPSRRLPADQTGCSPTTTACRSARWRNSHSRPLRRR